MTKQEAYNKAILESNYDPNRTLMGVVCAAMDIYAAPLHAKIYELEQELDHLDEGCNERDKIIAALKAENEEKAREISKLEGIIKHNTELHIKIIEDLQRENEGLKERMPTSSTTKS